MSGNEEGRSRARKAFVATCKDNPDLLKKTKVILDGSPANVRYVEPSKGTQGSYHVFYSKHAVQKSGSFCTAGTDWHPMLEQSESPCLEQARIDRHAASLPEPDHEGGGTPLELLYLHLFLADVDEEQTSTKFVIKKQFTSGKDDQYGNTAYSEIETNEGQTIYWGPRKFFQKTNFCEKQVVDMYLDIPSSGKGGLNEDTAIESTKKARPVCIQCCS